MLGQQLIMFETEQKEGSVLGSNVVRSDPQICLRKCILCSILVLVHTELFHPTENQFITHIKVNYPLMVQGTPESP